MTKPSKFQRSIIKSPTFILLNELIADELVSLKGEISALKGRFQDFASPNRPTSVRVKTSYEVKGNEPTDVFVEADLHRLKEIKDFASSILRREEAIRKLQVTKLRLLDDYDFTHGDGHFQKAVFGPDPDRDPATYESDDSET